MTETQTSPDPQPGADDALTRVARATLDLVGHLLGRVDRLVADARRDSAAVRRESQQLGAAAVARAASLRGSVRATPRLARILAEGALIAARYRVHHTRAARAGDAAAGERLEALHRDSARRLYDVCVELGGGVLKVGQFLSCRRDLLPPAYAEALTALQDRVPPVDAAAVIACVEEDLGADIDTLFRSFDPTPLATASLAQVHAAELADGTEVAVKVQLPGIEQVIETDIAALRLLAQTAGDLVRAAVGDAATLVDQLAATLREELDFCREARTAEAFRARIGDGDEVTAPRVHRSRCGRRVITMERIAGVPLAEYLDGCARRGASGAADRDRVLSILVASYCRQILDVGLFQADPHPGNFLVVTEPALRLVVLDFGSARALAPAERRGYAALVGAAIAGRADDIAATLGALGFRAPPGPGGRAALTALAEAMLAPFQPHAALADLDPRVDLERMLALTRRHPGVTVPEHFVLIGRVLGALAGLLFHHRPQISLAAVTAPHIMRALADDRPAA